MASQLKSKAVITDDGVNVNCVCISLVWITWTLKLKLFCPFSTSLYLWEEYTSYYKCYVYCTVFVLESFCILIKCKNLLKLCLCCLNYAIDNQKM